MAKQTINIGASPNDGTGTPLRTSFDYTNQNFTELYTAVGPSGNNIVVPGNATITGAVVCNGAVTLGDAVGDAINVNGSLTAYNGQAPSAIRAAASDYAAVNFDGATASTRITSTLTGQNIGTGDFSLWARFRVPALAAFANNSSVIGLGPNAADGSGNNSCRLSFLSGGTLSFRINDAVGATTSGDIANFSTNFSGQVVDVVVTRTGSTLKIYINGTDTAYTSSPAASTSINSVYCHAGIGSNSATIFTGRIYRSVVFNRALSATDVTELITTGVNPADQWGTQTQLLGFNPAVLNGGFETNSLNVAGTWSANGSGTSTATIDTSGSFSRTGTNAGKLTLDSLSSFVAFQASFSSATFLALAKRYRVSIWARKGAASGACGIQFGNTSGAAAYFSSGLVLTTSYANTLVEIVSANDGLFSISRQSGSAALSEIYIDDVEVTRIGAIVDLDFTTGGGTTAFDRSTNGLDGTLFGGVSWTMPQEGQYINGPSTITGDLTVRTTGLMVTSTGVGVGVTPATNARLQSAGTFTISGGASASAANGLHLRFDTGINTAYISAFHSGVDNRDLIYDAKSHVWQLPAGTAMTLNSTGLGIGTAPDSKLRVLDAAGNGMRIGFSSGSANLNLFDATSHQFRPLSGSGTNFAEVNVNGIGIARAPSASGIGIAFPATQVASSDANTLDDYEEGTFTPTVTSVGGTGIVYVADASDSGRYTKIGRVVTFQVRLAGTYTGTFSYIRVALPFSSTASNPDGVVSGYNNSTGGALTGRSDAGGAYFIVSNVQPSGNTAMYSGFITS
jgi:hypothetical protein